MFLWLKALHIVAVVAWMAGLLYLPRLYVYHEDAAAGSEVSELFKIMERRLLRAIMTPAAIATWAFGFLTAWSGGYQIAVPGWLIVKVLLVCGMTVLHVLLARWRVEFAEDRRGRGARFYRLINEAPTVLLIGIVVLVVVRPF